MSKEIRPKTSFEKLVIWQLCCDGGLFHFGNSLAYQNAFLL